MTRFVSFSALCCLAAYVGGCSANVGGDGASTSHSRLQPSTCDATDPTCTPCDSTDPSCAPDPASVPCDPADTACQPPPGDACAAQDVKADETCTDLLGYVWNGTRCDKINGCSCYGADCGSLFKTEADCTSHYAGCGGGAPDFCTATAQQLSDLLAAARSCNIASGAAMACDGTVVPTTSGCPVPVASGSSTETKKYLDLFAQYAKKCALPVPACKDPKGVPVDCLQPANIDGLQGQCSFSDGSAPSATAD